MYVTEWIKPNEEIHVAERLIEPDGTRAVSDQDGDNFQERILSVTCAGTDDAVKLVRNMQDSDFHFDVNNGMTPVSMGLALYKGTVTGKRYLPIGTRDDGSYTPGYEL
jgi:hypothetical protein